MLTSGDVKNNGGKKDGGERKREIERMEERDSGERKIGSESKTEKYRKVKHKIKWANQCTPLPSLLHLTQRNNLTNNLT